MLTSSTWSSPSPELSWGLQPGEGWSASPSGTSTTQFSPWEIQSRGTEAQDKTSGQLEQENKKRIIRRAGKEANNSASYVQPQSHNRSTYWAYLSVPDTVPCTLHGLTYLTAIDTLWNVIPHLTFQMSKLRHREGTYLVQANTTTQWPRGRVFSQGAGQGSVI